MTMRAFLAAALGLCLMGFHSGRRSLPVEEREAVERTFRFAERSVERELEVDNLDGSIVVAGHEGEEVELVVETHRRARSAEKLELARREVRLDTAQEGNRIRLYVDAPYRCPDGSVNYAGSERRGYEVRYDFALKVPRTTRLILRTVAGGDIRVSGVGGDFDLDNVNGGIELAEAEGAGRAYAVNGAVKLTYAKNPQRETYFGSLNGDVSVSFLADLSADLLLKTFNGEVYTDFAVDYLPVASKTAEREGGRYLYRSSRFFGLRVGSGGPELSFDAFNGNIHILQRGEKP